MTTGRKNQPSKGQAVFMAVIALLWMANNAMAVLAEGRQATVFFWLVMALNVILLGVSVWLYFRAARTSKNI
jgi:uncharacterized membrane protein